MNPLLDGLKSLGAGRLIVLAAVAVAMMGLLTVLALRGPEGQMTLLYGDLDLREAGQIADALDRQKIPHQIGGGGQILVPADMVARARLSLAKDGLPSGGSIGYEIFDRGDNLTASSFQQALNQTRALEGELARTIRSVQGVKAVRVHLVLPRREPFARDRQDAQAAVQLTMQGAARLDNEGVRAILNLVAAAVPGLHTQNIALTDTRGNLLARAGEPVGPAASMQTAGEQRYTSEMRLSHAIEEMLERSLGPGHVRAEASIDYDYDQVHETQERYDPDGQVVRSTQNVTNSSKTTEAANSVSVQNNLPNADAGTNAAGTQEQHQEETTNYEIAKTVRTIVRDQPKVARISLAVMVDGVTALGPDGKPVWQERKAEELDRIARLVRSAIGFDEKRGDKVEVVSLRFAEEPEPPEAVASDTLPLGFEKSDLMRLAQFAVFGILGIFALLVVLRPMVRRLTMVSPLPALAGGADGSLALAGGQIGVPAGLLGVDPMRPVLPVLNALPPPPGPAGAIPGVVIPEEDESMVNVANVEGQLRASSIRRLADLVEKHPEESLSIVRAWMQQEPS
jgi:flagellar M-ring protein FliF